jgi:hypothetical protein
MIVSDDALSASGLALSGSMMREIQVRSREQPIKVHTLNEAVTVETAA